MQPEGVGANKNESHINTSLFAQSPSPVHEALGFSAATELSLSSRCLTRAVHTYIVHSFTCILLSVPLLDIPDCTSTSTRVHLLVRVTAAEVLIFLWVPQRSAAAWEG